MEKKRNKLVIIGNGFDLAHGFKTSYNDFMLWYLNDCIEKTIKNFSFKDSLLEGTRQNPKMIPQKLLLIRDFTAVASQNNINFFKISPFLCRLIDKHKEYNWVDIENEYYQSLIRLYELSQNINNELSISDLIKQIDELNQSFEFLRKKLEEYLTLIQKDDIPKCRINPDGKINQIFKKYSQEFYKNDDIETITFLNFNYTNTIERYIGNGEDLNYDLIYIHGKLNDSKNPVIFGFGDEIDGYYKKIEEANVNNLLDNFKSFWYFKTDNYQSLLRFIDSNIFDVEILGHSCGLSDRVLLNNIFEHENCQTIKINYHQRSETENDFFRKTQEISRHFKDKAKMRKVIVDRSKCQSMNDI
jgi:Bacteriophage abortive infection AbiH